VMTRVRNVQKGPIRRTPQQRTFKAAEAYEVLLESDILPEEVDGYRVKAVCVIPSPPIPKHDRICALVVSDEETEFDDAVMWQPPACSSAQQAISHLDDAFGVLGVWPAAWVAAERVLGFCLTARRSNQSATPKILEIGCGSGLPSLFALAVGAEVFATDLEDLPLSLLWAAANGQRLDGKLKTQTFDVLDAVSSSRAAGGLVRRAEPLFPSDAETFDAIVCSDCLYKHDVAAAIGKILARVLLRRPTTTLFVTDANRQARQTFLDSLAEGLGLGFGGSSLPQFKRVSVPSWAADNAVDPFDGTSTMEVGLLKLFSS